MNIRKINWKHKSRAVFLAVVLTVSVPVLCLMPVEVQAEETVPETEDLGLYAKAAVLMDGETGRILYGTDADAFMPNASTTKIMTCILAIENGKPDQICTASEYACSMPQTKCGFSPGDQFYLKDLLYSLMLESHNDSAVVIAESISGSVEKFADLMNKKAQEIGCSDTYFVTPNGLDAQKNGKSHGTTAADLARIMNYCRKNDTFLNITQTKTYSFSDVKKEHTWQVSNTNSFLSMEEGVVSGKTGYTSKAGYCYVCAYEKDGRIYTIALLACGWPNHKNYKWSDCRKLIAFGNEHYKPEDIIQASEADSTLTVPLSGAVEVKKRKIIYPNQAVLRADGTECVRLLADTDKITVRTDVPEKLKAPLKAGEEAGTQTFYINGVQAASRKLYLADDAGVFDFGWCIGQFLQEFLQKASFSKE